MLLDKYIERFPFLRLWLLLFGGEAHIYMNDLKLIYKSEGLSKNKFPVYTGVISNLIL